ncbi:MAG: DNRLRE domain-containing protein [Phycisphaerae bacterium]|nr:DNRLRE domain-containing protein [Phycisphaerae bacterium]
MNSKKRPSNVATARLLSLALALTANAGSITIIASRDNTLYDDSTGSVSNGAGEHFFAGRTAAGGVRRGLIQFDLAGSALPPHAVITDARVELHVSRTVIGPAPFGLHRLLADWGEGASNAGSRGGAGAATQNGDATWLHRRFPGFFWTAAGGDFVPNASATTLVDGVGPYVWDTTPTLLSDVRFWLENPALNHGWCVIGDEADASAKRFDTRENIDPAVRPRLVLEFVVPPVCPGDQNSDGLITPDDFPSAAVCISAPDLNAPSPCLCSDFDNDADVDLRDLAVLQRAVAIE